MMLKMYQKKLQKRLCHPNYQISLVLQTGPEKRALPTHYLCELMGLSRDQPTNLYAFSPKKAKKKLLASPLIKKVDVKPVKPSAIYVDYTARVPIAELGEYPNCAIDDEGIIFPLEPYLTPKNLPILILGKSLSLPLFDQKLDMRLTNDLLRQCDELSLDVKRIDLKDINAKSIGRRQIILQIGNHLLRLTPKNYREELANYIELTKSLANEEEKVIDFRLENTAFMSES